MPRKKKGNQRPGKQTLTQHDRKVYRDHLNRRRNTLLAQGVPAKNIKSELGAFEFAGLTDAKLRTLYEKSKSRKPSVVVAGKIIDKEYNKKLKAWYGDKYQPDRVANNGGRKKQRLKEFKSVREIEAYKRDLDKQVKDRYTDHLEYQLGKLRRQGVKEKDLAEFKKAIKRVKRFSRRDFKKFLQEDYSSKIDFDRIFLIDSPTNQTDADYNEEELITVSQTFRDINSFSQQYVKSKKDNVRR